MAMVIATISWPPEDCMNFRYASSTTNFYFTTASCVQVFWQQLYPYHVDELDLLTVQGARGLPWYGVRHMPK